MTDLDRLDALAAAATNAAASGWGTVMVDVDIVRDLAAAVRERDELREALREVRDMVAGMRTYPFREAPYGDKPYATVLQSAVLELLDAALHREDGA